MLPIGAHDAGPRPWASLSISEPSKTSNKVVVGERHVFCCWGLNCQPQRQGKKIMILIQQRTKRVPCHCQLLCFDQNPCFWGQEGSLAVGYLVSTFCPFAAQLSAIDTMLQCSILHITRLWSCTVEEPVEHFRCNLISPTAIKWGSPWPVATKLKQWLLAKQYKGEADSTALDTKQNIAWRLKKKIFLQFEVKHFIDFTVIYFWRKWRPENNAVSNALSE